MFSFTTLQDTTDSISLIHPTPSSLDVLQSARVQTSPTTQAHPCALPFASTNDERCMYPSKPCPYKRAIKINGRMHRMCQFHREQANRNQRRVEARKRAKRLQRTTAPTPYTFPFSTQFPSDQEQVVDGLMPLLDAPLAFPPFSAEEIETLFADLSRDDWSDLILLD